MNTAKAVRAAYLKNQPSVRNLFVGFFSQGIIDRICWSLRDGNDGYLTYLETREQRKALADVLRGIHRTYNPYRDPELATATIREIERAAF